MNRKDNKPGRSMDSESLVGHTLWTNLARDLMNEEDHKPGRSIDLDSLDGHTLWTNLAHDLRGSLHSILGFAEGLLNEILGPLNDEQKEYITMISERSQKLLQLLNSALAISRLRVSGRLQTGIEDLNDIIIGAISEIQVDDIAGSDVNIDLVQAEEPIPVVCSEEWTVSALAFLLTAVGTAVDKDGINASVGTKDGGGLVYIQWITSRSQTGQEMQARSLRQTLENPTGIKEYIIALSMLAGKLLIDYQGGKVGIVKFDADRYSIVVLLPGPGGNNR